MPLQGWQCQEWPTRPSEEPSWGPQEGLWFQPPLLEDGPTLPPSSMGWGAVGDGMLGCPTGPTLVCESTCTHSHSSQPLPGLAGEHTGLIRASASCLAASASPAPTPSEPSWKAASLPAGGAGGWAWEAPRVSTMVPLPQHLQGLNSASSCCTVGAPAELTHMCYGVVHQQTHTLSLLLEHTQACTLIFKQSRCPKDSKHTQTHGVCTHQFLDSELTHIYTLVS